MLCPVGKSFWKGKNVSQWQINYLLSFHTIVKITGARPVSLLQLAKFWKRVLTGSWMGPWTDEWIKVAVEWSNPLCFMTCCNVLTISGGSLGEADITKSCVLGVAWKRKPFGVNWLLNNKTDDGDGGIEIYWQIYNVVVPCQVNWAN